MRTLAGDLPGYEEASRAFWRGERKAFDRHVREWPADVRAYVRQLAIHAWDARATGA